MSRRGWGSVLRCGAGLAALAAVLGTEVALVAFAEDERTAAAGDAGTATQAEIEVLRRLLGVPEPAAAIEDPADHVEVAPQPVLVELPAVAVESLPVAVDPPPTVAPKKASKPPAATAKPKPKPKPKPKLKPKPASPAPTAQRAASSQPETSSAPTPTSTTAAPSSTAPGTLVSPPTTVAVDEVDDAATGDAAASVEVPRPGTVVSAANLGQWKHLLGPSVQWAIERGASVEVAETRPMHFERQREEATQRYHAQVELSADKRSMRNYVAGIPFPLVDVDDPDAAPKMMFNMENRINQDDIDARNFRCDTGKLDSKAGFSIERSYAIEHFRRLYYTGRLWVDPKPALPNPDGIRYLEMLYPLQEPFDLKGAGFTYVRYLDPNRQDDSWLYFPQQKRVRRLGTAQRSEGVFGQDVDLDSYGGFAGNPAWTKWTLLGKKTILASLHARNTGSRFQAAPADYFPDDIWEAREVYVILGISSLGGYNFGRRIIYLDSESWIIPYTEIYDLNGQLWRTLIHTWKFDDRPRPQAKKAVYEDETFFISAFTLIDMQLEHATRCQFPSPDMRDEDGWYYHFGEAEGTTPEVFSVSNFIATGR